MRKGLVLVALCIALAGTVPAASAAEIGVILAETRQVFWRTMTAGIIAAAADLKVGVVIHSPVDGAAIEGQSNIQLRFIEYLMQQGVAGIVLAPEPLTDVKTPVSIAVPIDLVDRSSTDYEAISSVATDNFAAGRAAEAHQPPEQVAVDVITVTQANLDDETVQALLAHYRE
jgi:ribose transport system substrate-binding protein